MGLLFVKPISEIRNPNVYKGTNESQRDQNWDCYYYHSYPGKPGTCKNMDYHTSHNT